MNAIAGTLVQKFDDQVINDRFKKREFVIQTEGDYPQEIILEFQNDKCELLDSFNVGDKVECKINIRGRKWEGPNGTRYFVTLQSWAINRVLEEISIEDIESPPTSAKNPPIVQIDEESEDGLPF